MATTVVNVDRMKAVLECAICLDTYDNPKSLSCTHHFCKTCLDEIVMFNEDGSGEITCPLRCEKKTWLAPNETADDLIASYDFINLIEALNLNDCFAASPQPPTCTSTEGCQNHISFHCNRSFFCEPCHVQFLEDDFFFKKSTKLMFNKKENKMEARCEEHKCACKYLCVDNELLCRYCVHRNIQHKQHKMTLISTEIASLKTSLNEALEAFKERWSAEKERTLEHIDRGRENLDVVLKARKQECLDRYSKFLDAEEKKLKEEYERISVEHMDEYTMPERFLQRYQDDKTLDLRSVLEKARVQSDIKWCTQDLGIGKVYLSAIFDYLSDHPLGGICTKWPRNVQDDPVVGYPTLTCNFSDEHLLPRMCLSNSSTEDHEPYDEWGCCYSEVLLDEPVTPTTVVQCDYCDRDIIIKDGVKVPPCPWS